MENIYIEGFHGQSFIPTVDFNSETGICELRGESHIEDASNFYKPLIKWLKDYTLEVNKPIIFNFKLRYFNTSSSKAMIEMLHILKKYEDNKGKLTVNWHIDSPEEDMQDEIEEVEDFMIETGLEINLVSG